MPARAATIRDTSGWLPWWDQQRALSSFNANASRYQSLSPFWYELSAGGAVVSYSGAGSQAVIDAARNAGVPLLPTINNDFDAARVRTMMTSASSRAAHVGALRDLAINKGYAGIDIDYENLAATDRSAFTTFVRDLASSLHAAGKKLSVTVHPKTAEPGTWDGPKAQDYAALGAVADIFRPMAYDYSWSTSPAGPIAPASWVDDVARFTASVVPASKIQLGLPLYGYDWVGSRGEGITFDQVKARLTESGATVQWSDTYKSPWFRYTRDGVTHTVWFENAASIAVKRESVTRHGLAGAVFWRLGGEDAAVWGGQAPVEDITPPAVRITSPRPNSTLRSPSQSVSYSASDASGTPQVRVFVDGQLKVTQTTTSGKLVLDTRPLAKGRHLIRVDAVDAAGNMGVANVYVYKR